MGLFDVFSKGGKYFGKAIEPKCEYCEFGKRTKDGDKVLCTKKGMVDASFHCPKFVYSPLKRIPVKQMNLVGFLEGDYDEKDDEETTSEQTGSGKPSDSGTSADTAPQTAAPASSAPAASAAPAPAKPVAAAADLAALAAAAEAIGDYAPDASEAPQDENSGSDMSSLSSM